MKMTTTRRWLVSAIGAFAVAGCCSLCDGDAPAAVAISPDGRNSIRLYLNPLAYEVARDGELIVAKSEIGMKVNGRCIAAGAKEPRVTATRRTGRLRPAVYKKAVVDLAAGDTFADFGDFGVRLVARNDGVAYRFETKMSGEITVDCEKAELTIADRNAKCLTYRTTKSRIGCEEKVARVEKAADLANAPDEVFYLPMLFASGQTVAAAMESDVFDYPILNRYRTDDKSAVRLASYLSNWPTETVNKNWDNGPSSPNRLRKMMVVKSADYLVRTEGTRTFPWRTVLLADNYAGLCESDLVFALARGQANYDFSWVKPGKVAWDWWNAFDNQGTEKGCNTKTYERFIDFAAKNGVEYVIFDEGWSEVLNIWKFHRNVDVPHLIRYANERGVGIILWMAWAQIAGDEAHVAEYFGKLGAKGFKVDFMDRGDADLERFLWKFADECAKRKLLLDYHGVHRPTGMQRAYPNVLNFEGIHGLECMKWYSNNEDFMFNDIASFFGRFTAGPADYTPGAMDNYRIGKYPKTDKKTGFSINVNPGSIGTRCHQMAMMAAYEAPLQMLSDSPTKYERNLECFGFMAKVPVTWADTIGLGGCPESFAAVARQAADGAWYAAALNGKVSREFAFKTDFLGNGRWTAEIFRDADDCNDRPEHYVHETRSVTAGEKLSFKMADGGGFIVKFVKK